MKVLIDMNLSPKWTEVLVDSGIEAVHWSQIGPAATPDSAIMAYAEASGYVVLTNDLDFGIALAASNNGKPSVAQIRGEDLRPASIGSQVVRALHQSAGRIGDGSIADD